MKVPALSTRDRLDIARVSASFATSTPLWYSILAEAKTIEDRLNLGPVGRRIVAETLIGCCGSQQLPKRAPHFQPPLGTDLRLGAHLNPGNRPASAGGRRRRKTAEQTWLPPLESGRVCRLRYSTRPSETRPHAHAPPRCVPEARRSALLVVRSGNAISVRVGARSLGNSQVSGDRR